MLERMFIVCRVTSGGRILVPDIIKEVDEGQSFREVFHAHFDPSYCLQEVYLSEDSSGRSPVREWPSF